MPAEQNIVGEVGLKVTPVDSGFNAGVQKIINKIEAEGGAKIPVTADTTQANQAVDQLVQKSGVLGESWAKAGLEVAAFTAAVYGVRAAVDSVINKFAGLFDQLTQAKAGFASILKSENAGNNLLDDIQEFARVSPFVTGELVNYSQQLLGVGVAAEKIVPLLTRTGDIISSVGGDTQNIGRVLFTLTQIQSIGRLTGQDAIQLQSALIPITKYLADYLGKTTAQVKKMQEAGSISAETVFAAISAQGEKVEGAMDNATRTIGGAKSVLQDTVTIFLQSQPVLQKIYEDLVNGIKGFAEALGDPEVQSAATAFFDQIDRIYEGLKPMIEQLAQLGGSGGLTALSVFTQLLSTLATVLESIDPEILRFVATALAAIATIKAPLMLIQYVNKLGDFSKGLFGLATATQVSSAALDQETAAMQRNSAAAQANAQAVKARSAARATAIGIAAVAAGSIVNDQQGGAREGYGSVLTSAGTGAAIGAQAGPWGAVAGAAIGTGIGLFAFNSKMERAAKEKAAEAAKTSAEEFVFTFQKELNANLDQGKGEESFTQFFGEIESNQSIIDNYTKVISDAQRKLGSGDLTGGFRDVGGDDLDKLSRATDLMGDVQEQIDLVNIAQTELINSETGEYFQGLIDKLNQLDGQPLMDVLAPEIPEGASFDPMDYIDSSKYTNLRNVLGGLKDVTSLTGGDIAILNEGLKDLGVTFEDVATKTPQEIDSMITRFLSMPEAFKDATTAALDFNLALEAIKKGSAEIFGPFKQEIAETAAQLNAAAEINAAFGKLYEVDKTTGKSVVRDDLGAIEANALGMQILSSATKEYENALLGLGDTVPKAEAEALAQAAANRTTYGEFKILQETLGLTGQAWTDYLNAAGLGTLYASSMAEANTTTVETLDQVSSRLGIAKEDLIEYYGIVKANETTRIISSEETDDILSQLAAVNSQIDNYTGSGTSIVELERSRVALMEQLGIETATVTANLEEQVDAEKELASLFSSRAARYTALFETSQSFNDTLGSLFEVSEQNTVVVTDNIETIANAAVAILGNASSAFDAEFSKSGDAALAEAAGAQAAVAQFEALRIAMGLTNDQFQALLGSLGLLDEYQSAAASSGGALTGTLQSISDQTGIAVDDLAEMAGIIGAINPNTEIIITANIQQALDKIAELETMKAALDGKDLASGASRDIDRRIANENAKIAAAGGVIAVNPDTERQEKEAAERKLKAQQDAEKAAAEAADKARRELEAWQRSVETATNNLTSSLTQAAESIADAADRWVTSIKERTQYETAVSVSRLTKNAERQSGELEELQSGIANLKSRGVSQEVLDALGIDNVADLRQLRKLVKANDSDLAGLTTAVGKRDASALELAQAAEDKRTRDNITAAIMEAATQLGLDTTKEQAAGISNQFNIAPGMNADDMVSAILGMLSGGRIG